MDDRLDELGRKDFRDELLALWDRAIVRREPLCLMRFGDGEGLLMRGTEVLCAADGWTAPARVTRLGADLLETLQMTGSDVYIGLSDLTLFPGEMVWALPRCRQPPEWITFACLFGNANHGEFCRLLSSLDEPTIVLGSERANTGNLDELRAREFHPLPANDCVGYWEQHGETLCASMEQLARRYSETLFLLAGGPVAKILVARMWRANPSNRYLDVGSAVDHILFGRATRPYHDGSDLYATFSLKGYYAWKRARTSG